MMLISMYVILGARLKAILFYISYFSISVPRVQDPSSLMHSGSISHFHTSRLDFIHLGSFIFLQPESRI